MDNQNKKDEKEVKKPVKTIGEIRVYRANKLYLYVRIPTALENYFKEHLPVRKSTTWQLKNGEYASFYCFTVSNEVDAEMGDTSNTDAFAPIERRSNKGQFTKRDSIETENLLNDTITNHKISQRYLVNNYGTSKLYSAENNSYNVALLRTVGASKGITLICDGLLPPDCVTEYVSVMGQTIKSLYVMLVARTDIRAKVVLDINL